MALSSAIRRRNLAEALALIAVETDLNAQDGFGSTALIYACQYNLPEVVNALIAAGADVNIQNNIKRTPLIVACESNLPHLAVTLIAAKADLNVQITNGNTALMLACESRFSEVALTLIAAGADINIQNCYGNTALFYAAKLQLPEVVLKIAKSGSLNYHPAYNQFHVVQKVLSFNFSQLPHGYEFTLNDTYLLNATNFTKVKTLMLIRNQVDNCLHILPLELMELLFVNMFS